MYIYIYIHIYIYIAIYVACSGLTEHEVIRPEELPKWSSAHTVHGTWLEIHQDSARDVAPTCGFVEVDIYALQLQVGVTVVRASRVNTVLVRDHLPKFGSNLISALAGLDVYELAHGVNVKS